MSAQRETGRRRQSLPGDRISVGLLTAAAVTGLTLSLAFGLLALDFEFFWMVFVVGFGVVLPTSLGVVALLWGESERTVSQEGVDSGREQGERETQRGESETPLAELRMRYARGELTEEEFERRLDHLVQDATET